MQSFPEANHAYDEIDSAYRKKYQTDHPEATKDELKKVSAPFKVIYGMEAYLVDDVKDMVNEQRTGDSRIAMLCLISRRRVFSPVVNQIIEIGAVRVENGIDCRSFFRLSSIRKVPIPFQIEQLTGINDNMVVLTRRTSKRCCRNSWSSVRGRYGCPQCFDLI